MEHWNKKSQKEFLDALTRESVALVGMLAPGAQGFFSARDRVAASCPYKTGQESSDAEKWWAGYGEGIACFGSPISPVVVPHGHDHPEWV